MMPVIVGFTVVLRNENNIMLNHIPIIMLTAKSSGETVAGLEMRCRDIYKKPFDTEELFITVHNI